jgi:hypothetical protein
MSMHTKKRKPTRYVSHNSHSRNRN